MENKNFLGSKLIPTNVHTLFFPAHTNVAIEANMYWQRTDIHHVTCNYYLYKEEKHQEVNSDDGWVDN
eukprot:9861988-Ditylum_brightwellii.AAC.1